MIDFPTYPEVGLPDSVNILRLAFHENSGMLFAHVKPCQQGLFGSRLYFRRAVDSHYQSVATFPQPISISSFQLDPVRPLLYFLTEKSEQIDEGTIRTDWDALHRFDLNERRSERLARRADLSPPEGCESACLSELLSVSNDGLDLFCKAGLDIPMPELGEFGGARLDYWISRLELANLKLKGITKLAAFFA